MTLNPYANINQQKFNSIIKTNGKANQCNGISTCDIEATQQQVNLGARFIWQSKQTPFDVYLLANQLQEDNTNIALNDTNAIKFEDKDKYDTQEFGLNIGDSNLKTSLNWSNGIRTPTLFELFGDRGSFKGNDNLLPEQSETYSLSAQYQASLPIKKQDFTFDISSAIYQQTLENAIVAIFNASGTGSYTNVNNAELIGFEMQAGINIFSSLSVTFQVHLIDSLTDSEIPSFNNKKLPGIYHQQYSMAVQYQLDEYWRAKISTNVDEELYFQSKQ